MPAAQFGHSVADLTQDRLREIFTQWEVPAFRANQVLEWVYKRGIHDYRFMSNVPKPLRERLAAELPVDTFQKVQRFEDGEGTTKLYITLHDGHGIECVLIREGKRRTVCVSSQAGCAMGCRFCASGLLGLARNLTVGEIVGQVIRAQGIVAEEHSHSPRRPERVTNLVLMGSGEPFANLDGVLEAVERWLAPWGLGIGARKITVSTVGVPTEGFLRLAKCGHPLQLAVSLHAPDDKTRQHLIPMHRATEGFDAILAAMRRYFEDTGREPTVEYTLIANENDSPEQAETLARAVKQAGNRMHVNLIPYNPVQGLHWQTPDMEIVTAFAEALERHHVRVTTRKRMGRGVDAACGQLRLRKAQETEPRP